MIPWIRQLEPDIFQCTNCGFSAVIAIAIEVLVDDKFRQHNMCLCKDHWAEFKQAVNRGHLFEQ